MTHHVWNKSICTKKYIIPHFFTYYYDWHMKPVNYLPITKKVDRCTGMAVKDQCNMLTISFSETQVAVAVSVIFNTSITYSN